MFKINSRLNQLGFSQLGVTKSNVDVNEIVPLSLIFEDKEFAEYMRQSNDIIGRDRPRLFDQVEHQTTNASIENKYFFNN